MNNNDSALVVVDAGHGGTDSGAVNGNVLEKDFTLKAAQYIFKRLEQLGIPAVMTRDSDIYLPKNDRIKKVDEISPNTSNVILVSNHINAGGGEGAEVVYALRNNSTLADMILNNIGDAGQIKRKTYQRRLPENPSKDYYYIIRETAPRESVLIEYGFIDNRNDLNKLQNNLDSYAEGVVKAIADYLNVPYTTSGSNIDDNIPQDNLSVYIVQRGDTLYGIASKYNVSVDELKRINKLFTNSIYIGQQLLVPDTSTQIPDNTTPIVPNIPNDNMQIYTVQRGDSLWSIAKRFGITVNDLINANNLSNLIIYVGQQLYIPTMMKEEIIYTVNRGDTLYNIANRFNTTVNKIIEANNLSSTLLQIGQQLIIPQ